MNDGVKRNGRRKFGRRNSSEQAWITALGVSRLSCIVSNLSEGGALLEFEQEVPTANRFFLITKDWLEGKKCQVVRKQSNTMIGVQFI